MMDWIDKIPDSMTGALVSAALWFGFNYVVLAPRAMEKDHAATAMPQCLMALDQHQSRQQVTLPSVGKTFGLPGFDDFHGRLLQLALPRVLSPSERADRCACAVRRAERTMRFDYAIHTASFRLIAPQSVALVGDEAIGFVLEGVCGVLPRLNREG